MCMMTCVFECVPLQSRSQDDVLQPLFVVLLYALLSVYGQFQVVSWILFMWILGSFFVHALIRVLGGDVGFAQTLGVTGYSLLPLAISVPMLPLAAPYPAFALVIKVGHPRKDAELLTVCIICADHCCCLVCFQRRIAAHLGGTGGVWQACSRAVPYLPSLCLYVRQSHNPNGEMLMLVSAQFSSRSTLECSAVMRFARCCPCMFHPALHDKDSRLASLLARGIL
jgi:hypothetical protein